MSRRIEKILPASETDTRFYFGAGPAMLPREVLEQAREELLDWHGTGISVLEMGHRSDAFRSIADQAGNDLRELLSVPSGYEVLFIQGGASNQFAMVPLNLLGNRASADYVHTGYWSGRAMQEAARLCEVNTVISNAGDQHRSIPPVSEWQLHPDAAYVYYTDNETIQGVEFSTCPETGEVPLVSDMTSNLLSRPVPVQHYGIIFAGTQKNMGTAGLAVVIIREDLVGRAQNTLPALSDYAIHVQHHSLYNTPATFSWYISSLVLQWLKKQGGIAEMEKKANQKSAKLYGFIDNSDFYLNHVDPDCRSRMNIPFNITRPELEEKFLLESEQHGLLALAGHRSVGAMRASIYNAMPMAGVDTLIEFMADFEQRHG